MQHVQKIGWIQATSRPRSWHCGDGLQLIQGKAIYMTEPKTCDSFTEAFREFRTWCGNSIIIAVRPRLGFRRCVQVGSSQNCLIVAIEGSAKVSKGSDHLIGLPDTGDVLCSKDRDIHLPIEQHRDVQFAESSCRGLHKNDQHVPHIKSLALTKPALMPNSECQHLSRSRRAMAPSRMYMGSICTVRGMKRSPTS